MSTEQSRRLWLFSQPRTTSNLFMRLMEGHPNITQTQYLFFAPYFLGPDRQAAGDREDYKYMPAFPVWEQKNYQNSIDATQKWMKEVEEKGNIPLIMDHAMMLTSPTVPRTSMPGKPKVTDSKLDGGRVSSKAESKLPIPNPTFLPDRFALTLTPVFTMRHPALVLPSYLKAVSTEASAVESIFGEECATATSFKNQIQVFDFYKALNGEPPVVVDGERLVKNTQAVMKKVCEKLGLDESNVKYEWESKDVNLPKTMDAFTGKVNRSTGVIQDAMYDKPVDIDEQKKKWEKTWGQEVANRMEELVRDAMKDYEYLLQYSL
ncbi:hypothetical protein AAF712_006883 [Marasmius tenuissimus]|uniref:Sulfotransferase n=1 Tax=Marasmius tenuissimus TaxID=585030 RepID=A0ABR2ZXJ5_9AGAR|nr:hypothetical protein PM082_010352 [Marasmius tenuissimus]